MGYEPEIVYSMFMIRTESTPEGTAIPQPMRPILLVNPKYSTKQDITEDDPHGLILCGRRPGIPADDRDTGIHRKRVTSRAWCLSSDLGRIDWSQD